MRIQQSTCQGCSVLTLGGAQPAVADTLAGLGVSVRVELLGSWLHMAVHDRCHPRRGTWLAAA
jgi:hypothetical protein